jgi:protein-S-isoprenylcysteine O-methyltransferase Ste14
MKALERIPTQFFFMKSVGVCTVALVWNLLHVSNALDVTSAVLSGGYLCVLLLLESKVALNPTGAEAHSDDRGTGQMISLARLANAAAALLGPVPWTAWQPWMVIPILLFLVGITIRQAAIHTLGRFYSRCVRVLEDHEIVTSGPYRFVRHPAYLGAITIHLGLTLFHLNVFSVLTLLLMVVPAFVWRIVTEERLLMQVPGYSDFTRSRRKLIPLVW